MIRIPPRADRRASRRLPLAALRIAGDGAGAGQDDRRRADQRRRHDALHVRQGCRRQERLQRPLRRQLAAADGGRRRQGRRRLVDRHARRRRQAVGVQGQAASTCGRRTRSPATRPATASTTSGTSSIRAAPSREAGRPSAARGRARRDGRDPRSPLARDAADATDAPGLPHPDLVAAIPRLRRYARVLTGEASRADDLVQDTLARGVGEAAAVAGGNRSARVAVHDHAQRLRESAGARAARRRQRVARRRSRQSRRGSCRCARNQLDRVELLEVVQQMGRLSADQREVLLLAAVEEMRYEEIAARAVGSGRHGDVAAVARARQAAAAGRRAGVGAARRSNEHEPRRHERRLTPARSRRRPPRVRRRPARARARARRRGGARARPGARRARRRRCARRTRRCAMRSTRCSPSRFPTRLLAAAVPPGTRARRASAAGSRPRSARRRRSWSASASAGSAATR